MTVTSIFEQLGGTYTEGSDGMLYRSFDFLNSTTGGCFISLSIFL